MKDKKTTVKKSIAGVVPVPTKVLHNEVYTDVPNRPTREAAGTQLDLFRSGKIPNQRDLLNDKQCKELLEMYDKIVEKGWDYVDVGMDDELSTLKLNFAFAFCLNQAFPDWTYNPETRKNAEPKIQTTLSELTKLCYGNTQKKNRESVLRALIRLNNSVAYGTITEEVGRRTRTKGRGKDKKTYTVPVKKKARMFYKYITIKKGFEAWSEEPVLDSTGKQVMVEVTNPVRNENGFPVLDENGKQVTVTNLVPKTKIVAPPDAVFEIILHDFYQFGDYRKVKAQTIKEIRKEIQGKLFYLLIMQYKSKGTFEIESWKLVGKKEPYVGILRAAPTYKDQPTRFSNDFYEALDWLVEQGVILPWRNVDPISERGWHKRTGNNDEIMVFRFTPNTYYSENENDLMVL